MRTAAVLHALAGLAMAVYVYSVLAGFANARLGWETLGLSDITEFLSVLISMVFFVAGLLVTEAGEQPQEQPQEPPRI